MFTSPASPSAPWRAARALPHPVHDPPRILVAEDDPEMRRILVEALTKDKYEVTDLPDGGRLLVELAHEVGAQYAHIDLIVSDIRMPVCSGLQILEALRTAQCHTPIILMTAFGDDETRAKAGLLGALLFDKPFELDDLRTAIVSLLQRGR